MENIEIKLTGNRLVITIPDVTQPGSVSSTGKTKLIASTRGAQLVEHPTVKGLRVAVNLTVPS